MRECNILENDNYAYDKQKILFGELWIFLTYQKHSVKCNISIPFNSQELDFSECCITIFAIIRTFLNGDCDGC